jgi:hypothetical protein
MREDHAGGACSTNSWEREEHSKLYSESLIQEAPWGPRCWLEGYVNLDLKQRGYGGVDWVNVAASMDECGVFMCTIMNLLLAQKRRIIYWTRELLLACQEGLCSTELVKHVFCFGVNNRLLELSSTRNVKLGTVVAFPLPIQLRKQITTRSNISFYLYGRSECACVIWRTAHGQYSR